MHTMRYGLALLILLGAQACGASEEPSGESIDYCARGLELQREAVETLRSRAPSCTRDDECIVVATDVVGPCGEIALCGDVLHRDVAPAWDAQMLGEEMCAGGPRPFDTSCSVQASCRSITPACQNGACVAAANASSAEL